MLTDQTSEVLPTPSAEASVVEQFFSPEIERLNKSLFTTRDEVRSVLDSTQESFTNRVHGSFVHSVPRYENDVLWNEQFFSSNELINISLLSKLLESSQVDPSYLASVLKQSNALGAWSMFDHDLMPSMSQFHALVAYFIYQKGLPTNNVESKIKFKSNGVSVDPEDVFHWDPSVIYSGGGANIYDKLVGSRSTDYYPIYSRTNQLYKRLMLEVHGSMMSEVNDESFTSALMLVGPSIWELDQVKSLHDQLNDPDLSSIAKKVDLFVVTQSILEINKISGWSGLSSPNLSVSIHGCDIRDLLSLNIPRKSNSRLDTLIKGLTSGNFTEIELFNIISNSTRPDDKCYVDFQAPSENIAQVIKAYEERLIVELVSHNFKAWLMRLGVPPVMLMDFESKVQVSQAEYVDERFAYAVPVVHHVDLDSVNPGIRKHLAEIGFEMPKHAVLCRSTRRDPDGFLDFLNQNNIPLNRKYEVDVNSGMICGVVLGQTN